MNRAYASVETWKLTLDDRTRLAGSAFTAVFRLEPGLRFRQVLTTSQQ